MLQIPMEQASSGVNPECNRAHSCLAGKQDCLCNVEQLVDDTILSVKPPPETKCTHKMRYRNAYLCTCPVRRMIYKRFKI